MTPVAQRTSESGAISNIFKQAIHLFSQWIRVAQCSFLTDIFILVYSRFD